MKDEFLATLSHELRTPLHAILGWVQLLVRGNIPAADSQRGLQAIERNSRLQAQLIDDLLDMSRIEAGKIRLDLQPVDLSLVLESAIAAATPAAESKGLIVERQIDPETPIVRGDPARLQQILWNLLSNAVKFTPAGGRIMVSLLSHGDAVELQVQDSGIGIRPELLDDVFDRFRQADPSTTRRYGGLGLGLAIARQLAEMHGGTLTAASEGEGQGATFTLRVPPMEALPVARPPLEEQAPPRDGIAGARILVVDDQADARDLVVRVLAEQGARVHAAESVGEALAWLERHEADVVISDISMPGRDGYDLMAHVRARWPDLPGIALTAFVRAEDAERARLAGFSMHLPKPLSPDRLARAVAALLVRTPR
jgi:CheY-like chemotaxis protein